MKACIIQPGYSTDYSLSDKYFQWELDILDRCDESMDIIVLPESADVPCYASSKEKSDASSEKYRDILLKKCSETAKRCNSVLFVNARKKMPGGLRNTTYAFDREGNQVGYYYKQHLTPGETSENKLDSEYTWDYEPVTVVEIDGVRYGFLVCYDFYFYEMFAKMARANLDVIIGCSHQRSDSHDALEMMTKFCAYNTGAYVLRSSISLYHDKEIGGCSMAVAPGGKVLANMHNDIGYTCVEFDPHEKYLKPAGYGNPLAQHYEYIEKGRRPWKYRNGADIARYDCLMPYPRICAHRGFNTVAPENSLPAFASAIALGAQEIEFDLWRTTDGEIVSCHDGQLDRVSNGAGNIWEKSYDELKDLDFGYKFSEQFRGLRIPKFEDILKKFAGKCVMNIHLKDTKYPPEYIDELMALIDEYDCRRHIYFMVSEEYTINLIRQKYPDVIVCAGADPDHWDIVEKAIRTGCQKVQLFAPDYNQEMIDKAHANGIKCNLFYADTVEDAQKALEMGIDTVLTNDYFAISQILK